MTLPEGWRPLTDEESSSVLDDARRLSPGLQLAAGFRAGDEDLPYLLVVELPLANTTLGALARSMRSQRVSEKLQDAARTLDQTDLVVGTPEIDERMKMVVMRTRSDVMQSLVALFPGRDMVVQLTAVFAPDAKDSDLAAFQAITSSFRFEAGRGYAPPIDKPDRAFWVSVGLLVIIVSGLVRSRRRRARPTDDRWESAPRGD